MNILRKIIYFYRRKIAPGFKVGKDALVVDLGSGDKPFWRGDVFLDDLALGDNQRVTHTGVVKDFGLFVDGSLPHTPFKDKAFDFSFCSHLLEHVPDPAAAINEIMRISKAGYIEVPNGILDTIAPFHSHLWFVYLNGSKLVFVRKSKKMHSVLSHNGKKFIPVAEKIKDPFIRFYWKDKIDYEIVNELGPAQSFSPIDEKHQAPSSAPYRTLAKLLRRLFYKPKPELTSALKPDYEPAPARAAVGA